MLFAALVLLGLVRPALKGTAKPAEAVPVAGGQLSALEADEPDRPALPAPTKKDEVVEVTQSNSGWKRLGIGQGQSGGCG